MSYVSNFWHKWYFDRHYKVKPLKKKNKHWTVIGKLFLRSKDEQFWLCYIHV